MPPLRSWLLTALVATTCLVGCTTTTDDAIASTSTDPIVDPLPSGTDTTVQRVVDGDTLVAANGDRIRLIGIDTPESVKPDSPVECFGKQAAERTRGLLPAGTAIRLEGDQQPTDRYGRTLAYVYRRADGLFVNADLVQDGYATTLRIPPNTRYADRFTAWQRNAQKRDVGLWGACSR